jgi:hypothetical protein
MTVSETGKADIHDLPCSGHPVTAVSPVTLQCADAIICEKQHVTTQKLALTLSVSKGNVSHAILDLW